LKEGKKKVNPLEWLTEPSRYFSAPYTAHTHPLISAGSTTLQVADFEHKLGQKLIAN